MLRASWNRRRRPSLSSPAPGSRCRPLRVESLESRDLLAASDVTMNEIHSDPDRSGEAVEFIELYNRGQESLDLSRWSFTDGVEFTFPENTRLAAGEYLVVAQNPEALLAKFAVNSIGPWVGRLSADGETIDLRDAAGNLVDRVSYQLGFPWPTVGDTPGPSMQLVKASLDNDRGGSWRSAVPTPGVVNSVLTENPPTYVEQVAHSPAAPKTGQAVTITAKVDDADGVTSVALEYQLVEPGQYIRLTDPEYATKWTRIAMRDDGQSGDAQASDNVYSVSLPGEFQFHRRLVRYRIQVADGAGQVLQLPYADDPQPNFAYFTYDSIPDWVAADRPGVTPPVTYGPATMNSLPAYHLIASETDVLRSQYNSASNDRAFRGTLFYNGKVYDHMEFKNRGQNSTYVTGKNKWKLQFLRGHDFEILDDYGRPWKLKARELNLGTAASPWARPNRGLAGMDEALAFKFFNLAGVPAPNISAIQFRVIDRALETDPESQYNGDLWGLYLAYEDPAGRFLEQHGLPDGNLFRMQGGTGTLRHQGLGLPRNGSDLRAFISPRTGYAKTNPIQPIDWWRKNVDLERYYSYRGVIEALNHSDLRDAENSLQYYNSETGKWAQLPWDLDLLYEEFDRWGPKGVQTNSPLEKVRLSLQHEEIQIEFQARLRELQDLLFNPDQAWQAVEEYARYVEPFAAVDRAMWDYNPRTSAAHKGYFYKSPAPYDGGAACCVRRELSSPDFEGMIDWVKDFIVDGGFGGSRMKSYHLDPLIPEKPSVTSLSDPSFSLTNLRFQTSNFQDPQGTDTFKALEWRLAEVTDRNAPTYDAHTPVHYEVTPLWQSGTITEWNNEVQLSPGLVKVGHAYRVRVRMQDQTGRWSHWSDAVQFIPSAVNTPVSASLRVSEINYHPSDPTDRERAAGWDDADAFEFIELTNVGATPIDLRGVQLTEVSRPLGAEGVQFDFSTMSDTRLAPGEYVVVVEDIDAFRARYGTNIRIAGEWTGRLDNASEQITLEAYGMVVQQFTYSDRWYRDTDGRGATLEAVDAAHQDLNRWNQPAGWQPSAEHLGSPGRGAERPGDANRDGIFNTADLVLVWQAGEYEDNNENNSTWAEGDWNGDGDFTSADLVLAFQKGW